MTAHYWVYPRVCGGTLSRCFHDAAQSGLSPRVRGNHASIWGIPMAVGSIPACAGEPRPIPTFDTLWAVYPRVCGGTKRNRGGSWLKRGLSPRVRGNHPEPPLGDYPGGSIPACAGEPARTSLLSDRAEVYPRVCGGTLLRMAPPILKTGLSPRVRGNLGS